MQNAEKVKKTEVTYEQWKENLIAITAKELGMNEWEVKINDTEARAWYESGISPYFTFRETWNG